MKLPFDVLNRVFDYLNRKTLFNLVLVNRTFNDAASPSLYRNLIIWIKFSKRHSYRDSISPIRDPFETLETKEELCSVVRTVELRVRGTFVQGDEDDALALIVCRRQLSSLQNVHTVQINDNDDTGNISAILGAISGLEHVRSLKFTVNLRREREYPPLAHVKELDIRTWSLDPWNGTSFLDKIRTFKVAGLSTSFDHLQYIGMLSNFKELHLGVICISPGDLCRVLGSAPKLTHLHFKYHLHIFFDYSFQGSCHPTGLTKLSHLVITFEDKTKFVEDDALYWLVDAIAGQSSLESLGIMCYSRRFVTTRCEKLLHHISKVHGNTLQKLKLPLFHVSKSMFLQLGRRLPNLTHLWVGATSQMEVWLANVLCIFEKLEHLRLYEAGGIKFPYSGALFQQSCPSLKVIKVCQRSLLFGLEDSDFLRYVWKSRWPHDSPFGAIRQIQGPTIAEHLTWDIWGDYQKDDYASDSGSEVDFG
ncbi:hypothetical protein FS842_008335 [Serendipita sp. 407]|nr:hypothetical protein FS842_008335 [Serendipita sp. 407]